MAEIRAPVGAYVAIAKFEAVRPLRVLDLNALSEVYSEISFFDSNYREKKNRDEFLKELVGEISRPVLPQDEKSEYIPTQVVSEYLTNRMDPPVDGIIFPSSQTGATGRNLVLFGKACSLERYLPNVNTALRVSLPKSYRTVRTRQVKPADLLIQTEPSEEREESRTERAEVSTETSSSNEAYDHSKGPATYLRLDIKSLKILEITKVKYRKQSHEVELVTLLKPKPLHAMASISSPTLNANLSAHE